MKMLDPFYGSGTSLLAAKMNDVEYVGLDNDENSIEISRNRLYNTPDLESTESKRLVDIFED